MKPNSGKEEIQKISDDEFVVFLKKPAEDNKANLELLKLMKKYFHREVLLLRGLKSRTKILEINDGN